MTAKALINMSEKSNPKSLFSGQMKAGTNALAKQL